MFGYVTANAGELSAEEKARYGSVYCGICRRIRSQASQTARVCLSYDMVFLALLLMSLYEPEETAGRDRCLTHPVIPRPWVDSEFIRYAADMNVVLAYYNFLDDWQDDRKLSARLLSAALEGHCPGIAERYPRQCAAIRTCIADLSRLEQAGESNPDIPAACFGRLMGELLVYREDLWAEDLRRLGDALGRFIYLLDGVCDYDTDQKKGKYNPFLAMGGDKDPARWEEYLLMTMGRCTRHFERLPLVQDKDLLNNILYSGVWVRYRRKNREETPHDR